MSRLEAYIELWSGRLAVVGFQTMLAVHALFIVSACLLVASRRRWTTVLATIALVLSGLAWLQVNQHWEGRTLLPLARSHAVTEADLVVPVVVTIALLLRAGRNRWTRA